MCSRKWSPYTYGMHMSSKATMENPGHWSCNSSESSEAISSLGLLMLKIKEEWKERIRVTQPGRMTEFYKEMDAKDWLPHQISTQDFRTRQLDYSPRFMLKIGPVWELAHWYIARETVFGSSREREYSLLPEGLDSRIAFLYSLSSSQHDSNGFWTSSLKECQIC